MADNATKLKATLREERGKGAARRLRRSGRIPAVIYGHGEDTRPLAVDAGELDRLFARISVENTLLDVEIEGEGEVKALVREVQTHPFKPEVLHVDFYQVHAGEQITLDVPIRIVGSSEGVREGGILEQPMHDIEVSCVPGAIPEAIEVDVTELQVGDSIHVRDLTLPEGVETAVDPDRTLCAVVPPSVLALEEEEEAAVPEAEIGVAGEIEPELIGEVPEEGEQPPATEQGGPGGSEDEES